MRERSEKGREVRENEFQSIRGVELCSKASLNMLTEYIFIVFVSMTLLYAWLVIEILH